MGAEGGTKLSVLKSLVMQMTHPEAVGFAMVEFSPNLEAK
jgi:hypothetical protein